jgi:hypothetical protein
MAQKSQAGRSVSPKIRKSMLPSDSTLPFRLSQPQNVIQRMLRRRLVGGSHDKQQTANQASEEFMAAKSPIEQARAELSHDLRHKGKAHRNGLKIVQHGEPHWTQATFRRGSGLCLLVGAICICKWIKRFSIVRDQLSISQGELPIGFATKYPDEY